MEKLSKLRRSDRKMKYEKEDRAVCSEKMKIEMHFLEKKSNAEEKARGISELWAANSETQQKIERPHDLVLTLKTLFLCFCATPCRISGAQSGRRDFQPIPLIADSNINAKSYPRPA